MSLSAVLPLAVAVVCAAGCVVPPDVHERTDSVEFASLDRTLLVPSADSTVDLTSNITEFSVAAAISGADPATYLNYTWFVGYPESSRHQPPVYESRQAILFNACAFKDVLAPAGSVRTLELFITLDPVEFDSEKGRVIPEPYIYVSWPVRLRVACD